MIPTILFGILQVLPIYLDWRMRHQHGVRFRTLEMVYIATIVCGFVAIWSLDSTLTHVAWIVAVVLVIAFPFHWRVLRWWSDKKNMNYRGSAGRRRKAK